MVQISSTECVEKYVRESDLEVADVMPMLVRAAAHPDRMDDLDQQWAESISMMSVLSLNEITRLEQTTHQRRVL